MWWVISLKNTRYTDEEFNDEVLQGKYNLSKRDERIKDEIIKEGELDVYLPLTKNTSIYQDIRWDYDNGRRETWDETVERYFNFFSEWLEEKHEYKLENGERHRT